MRQPISENTSLPSNIKITVHRANKRIKLLHWLYEVLSDFSYTPYTYILTVSIIDKYKKMSDYQLLGITALFIAAKIEECECKSIHEYVEVTDNAYNFSDILRMEVDIMLFFNYNFNFVLPQSFLKERMDANMCFVMFVVVCYVLEKESNVYCVIESAKSILRQLCMGGGSKEVMFYFERHEKARMLLDQILENNKHI